MDILLITGVVLALAYWWNSAQSRETATLFARKACQRCGVQLLDDTVSVNKLRLRRTERGHMGIARWYTFEFSTSGSNRRVGDLQLIGGKLLDLHLDVDVNELPQ